MSGQYCSSCGQRHRTRMISVWELLRAAFDDILSWDSRVWRTLRPLLFSPGQLTAEYLAGRRVHYTPPLRMYLVLSISFFLLSSLPGLEDFSAANMLGVNENEAAIQLNVTADDEQMREPGAVPIDVTNETADDSAAGDNATVDDSGEQSDDSSDPCSSIDEAEVTLPGITQDAARKRLRRACNSLMSEDGRARFTESFGDIAPNLLIVLLPVIALVGKLIYPLSRRYYVEHLLFYTHLHSFLFLLLIVLMLLSAATPHLPVVSINMVYVGIAAGIYVVYYSYRALRRVFGQGRLVTVFKMFLLTMAYLIGASVLLAIGAALAALSL